VMRATIDALTHGGPTLILPRFVPMFTVSVPSPVAHMRLFYYGVGCA
jgi:hypothetical protein